MLGEPRVDAKPQIPPERDNTSGLRAELHDEISGVNGRISGLRAEMQEGFRRQTTWMVGLATTVTSLIIASNALTG